jgi:hypothetical protein
MIFIVLIILVFIGIVIWQFIEGQNATATTSVLTRYTPQQAAQIIDSAFGGARSMLWTKAKGPGNINRRRRGIRGGITMSIDLTPQQDGMTRVDMWASETVVYLLVLHNFAGPVNRRKRAIGRLLAEPQAQQLAPQPQGGQAPGGQQQPGSSAVAPPAADRRPAADRPRGGRG